MTESTDDLAYRLRCETKRTDLPVEVIRLLADAYAAICKLQAERDEARREVCGYSYDDPRGVARDRGWDCFKEKTNEQL